MCVQAAFSKAVQCVDLTDGSYVCIKIIKNNKDFFDQSLDEIKILKVSLLTCDNNSCFLCAFFFCMALTTEHVASQYINAHDTQDDHHLLQVSLFL